MAKKSAVNKSQAIRDALDANPGKSPSEVAELLSAGGLKVTPQYVSTIKSNAKSKRKGKRGGKRTVMRRKPVAQAAGNSVSAALALIRAAGGLSQAKEVLEAVEEIRSAI